MSSPSNFLQNKMHSITERDSFSNGFRLGVRLMTVAFFLPIEDDE